MKLALLKDVADIQPCIVTPPKNKENRDNLHWITAANLLSDNTITMPELDSKYERDEKFRVSDGDILIKRINPQYVNLIENIEFAAYASNNLYLIKPKDILSSYLGFVLNNCIESIAIKHSVGATIPTLSRKNIENIEIPVVPLYEQEKIGALWLCSIKKKNLHARLIKLEHIRETQTLTNYIWRGKNI